MEEAKQRFLAAQQLEDAGRWSEAARELKRALSLKETPGLRFHLAYCEEHQGHYVEALASYRRARELLDAGQSAEDVAELLGPAVERVESQIVVLEIQLESKPEGVEMRIDGRLVQPGREAELNPGAHLLQVEAPGWETFRRTLRLTPGRQSIPVLLKRKATPAAPVETPVEPPSPPAPFRQDRIPEETQAPTAKTWVLIGESILLGGTIAAGIGLALNADTASEHSDLARKELATRKANCAQPANSQDAELCGQLSEYEQSRDDARLFSTLAFVGAGATAAALALTALVWPDAPASARHSTIVPVGPRSSWGVSTRFAF